MIAIHTGINNYNELLQNDKIYKSSHNINLFGT